MTSALNSGGSRRLNAIARNSLGWLVLVLVVAAWQVAATASQASSVTSFSNAVGGLTELVTGPPLVDDVIPSLVRVAIGFSVAGVVGIAFGLLLGGLRRLDPWIYPLMSFLRSVPPPLIIPVAFLLVGLGPQLVVAVIVFGAFWPVLLNTFDGARRVEPLYLEVAAALHLGRFTRLSRVVLPASLPTIMAGLRTGLSISLIMMVVAEMLVATNGLGFEMSYAQQTFNVPGTYGAVLLLAIIGWGFDTLFVMIERRALRWHTAFQGGIHV